MVIVGMDDVTLMFHRGTILDREEHHDGNEMKAIGIWAAANMGYLLATIACLVVALLALRNIPKTWWPDHRKALRTEVNRERDRRNSRKKKK